MTKGDSSYKFASGTPAEPLSEQLARVWFLRGVEVQRQRDGVWDMQPDNIKAIYRHNAHIFLADPARPYREHNHLLYLLDNFLVDYRRGYVSGLEVVK